MKKGVNMGKLCYMVAFAAMVASAYALDNTIHNSFWDTRGYVNPAPSISRSEGSATATFDLSGYSRRIATSLREDFRSKMPGFFLSIR